jgi:hypothetical protein
VRKSATIWSSDLASRETWLRLIHSTPSCWTSFSTLRVETPCGVRKFDSLEIAA